MLKKFNLSIGIICLILLGFSVVTSFSASNYTIQIENSPNGRISIVRSGSFEVIGHVLYPTTKFNERGYTASQWIPASQVAATAVNAIHIKVDDAKTIFSILPREFAGVVGTRQGVRGYRSYLSPDASIYTDIPASQGIFGGGYAPFVGNSVAINGQAIKKDQTLQVGDVIQIEVNAPHRQPKAMVFENTFGGKITLVYQGGDEEVVGQVLRPVQGVGRFEGGVFLEPGRIRANHGGVIDVCTSTLGKVGGFQIIPAEHAQSPEMRSARLKTQWMVISAPGLNDPSISGQAPFFKGYLKPDYMAGDIESEQWYERLSSRYLVEAKLQGSDKWQPMPICDLEMGEELPSSADSALVKVEAIRILFPVGQ